MKRNKPITWKRFQKLRKDRKLYTVANRIQKYGILLTIEDANEFETIARKELKEELKELLESYIFSEAKKGGYRGATPIKEVKEK